MGVRENKVEKYLDEQVTKLGGITRKWVSPGRDGVPDRIVIKPVTVAEKIKQLQQMNPMQVIADYYLVEVKTVDGILSATQVRESQRLADVGAHATVVYGELDAQSFVDRFIK